MSYMRQIDHYIDMIVAEGDQGETFDAIAEVLRRQPQAVAGLRRRYLDSADVDRREIVLTALECYLAEKLEDDLKAAAVGWSELQPIFAWDGSWRDLYVPEAGLDDWQRLLDFVRALADDWRFEIDGQPRPLPESAVELFAELADRSKLLTVELLGVALHCHFFTAEEIEFDLDPRQVDDLRRAQALFVFIAALGTVLERPVRLTPENAPELPLCLFSPACGQWTFPLLESTGAC